MTRLRKDGKPARKPGPKKKAPRLVEGRDYFCSVCVGRKVIPCPYCLEGCPDCKGRGTVRCETCGGGTIPVPPPEWI